MSKEELEKTIIGETKDLSIHTLMEVLDFIHFIKMKKVWKSRSRRIWEQN